MYQSCNVFIFTKNEYDKLFHLKEGVNVIRIFDTTGTSRPTTIEAKKFLTAKYNQIFEAPFAPEVFTSPQMAYYEPHYFYVKLEEDGKTIRFQLPNNKELIGITEKNNIGILDQHDWLNIDKEYYELPISKWSLLYIE